MLFCIFSVNCCLYYNGYLIVRKLSHLTAHLLFHIFMAMLCVCAQCSGQGSEQEKRQKYKYVLTYQLFCFQVLHQQTPVVTPYSKMQLPKAKETRNRKEAGPQAGQGRTAEAQTPSQLPITGFCCCPEGASSSAQSSWWLQGELWPEAQLQDVTAEFRQMKDATNFPARARDFKVFLLKTPAGISPEFIQKTEKTPTLSYLYTQCKFGPIHSEVHTKSQSLLSCGGKRRKSRPNLWSSTGKGTALKQTSISFLLWL